MVELESAGLCSSFSNTVANIWHRWIGLALAVSSSLAIGKNAKNKISVYKMNADLILMSGSSFVITKKVSSYFLLPSFNRIDRIPSVVANLL